MDRGGGGRTEVYKRVLERDWDILVPLKNFYPIIFLNAPYGRRGEKHPHPVIGLISNKKIHGKSIIVVKRVFGR